ncbi:MAG: type II secretion system GspH family protein [Defluviitaleaceae bacterium]|nr:type II secretion system GspH family protein [Defluviitaleaceae bacterium]
MKKTRGFSYIEVILAMALFAIAMLAIIPTLSQAGRNISFAMEAYDGHLQAGRVMLTVREALINGTDPEEMAIQHASGRFEFSVWVFGRYAQEFHTIDEPDATVAVTGTNIAVTNHSSTIVAVVWGDDGQVVGRAIGMLYS